LKNNNKINRLFIKGVLIIVLVSFLPNLIRGKIVKGTVVDIKEVPTVFSSNITTGYPIIIYKADNKLYKFIAGQNLNVEKNEQVKVIYIPGKPEKAKVLSFAGFWLVYIITLVSGVFFWYALIASFPNKIILRMFSQDKTNGSIVKR
jgi:hypothetical protein